MVCPFCQSECREIKAGHFEHDPVELKTSTYKDKDGEHSYKSWHSGFQDWGPGIPEYVFEVVS